MWLMRLVRLVRQRSFPGSVRLPRIAFAALFLAAGALMTGTLATGAWAASPQFPTLSGRVVDQAGILSPDVTSALTRLLAQHEQQTGQQVVVATLKTLDGQEIEQYGYQLGRAWGIGQKGKNTGALLIVSMNPHRVRIEVGYGLEGALTDAQSKLIIENAILPAFKQGDYNAGILNGTVQILRTLGGKPSLDGATEIAPPQNQQEDGGIPIIPILILLFVGGRFFWPLLLMGGLGGGFGGGRGGGFGGGFGGGGGGFGGGGFSGGGGSFGGGGASGSW